MNESVDKKIEYDDLQAYQEQQKLEVVRLKKSFGKSPSTYRERNTSIGAILLSRLITVN